MSAKIHVPKSIENLSNLSNKVSKSIFINEKIQRNFSSQQKFVDSLPKKICIANAKFKVNKDLLKLVSNQELTILKGKNNIGMSSAVIAFNYINTAKKLSGLQTKLSFAEEEKKKNQKLRNELSHWINKYESDVFSAKLVNEDYNEWNYAVCKSSITRSAVESLNDVVGLTFSAANRSYTLQELYAERVAMLADANNEIKENDKTISYIKAVKTFLNNVFKRFEVNIRQFIGSINNFNFKNLDDTHSLISLGY